MKIGNIHYRLANESDVRRFAKIVRGEDREDLESRRTSVLASVLHSWRFGKQTWLASIASYPVALFGVTAGPKNGTNQAATKFFSIDRDSGPIGIPWLYGTDDLVAHRKALLRDAARFLEELHRYYPHLASMTPVENTVTLHWLQRLGFQLFPAVLRNGSQFIPYIRSRVTRYWPPRPSAPPSTQTINES